jgi:hypothetical protein
MICTVLITCSDDHTVPVITACADELLQKEFLRTMTTNQDEKPVGTAFPSSGTVRS